MPSAIPLATRRKSPSRRNSSQSLDPRKRMRGTALYPGSDYSDDELEFMNAVETYKRERRRPFPQWTEVLAVLRSLGYVKADLPRRPRRPNKPR